MDRFRGENNGGGEGEEVFFFYKALPPPPRKILDGTPDRFQKFLYKNLKQKVYFVS